eukprot:GHVQ01041028.1.p1 GENE.GHVQ01041028.1~~GHVQ01041028.1.p1  ORF type:complete len:107 (-),score=22.63 GHVQ01041028.1:132-452(-)
MFTCIMLEQTYTRLPHILDTTHIITHSHLTHTQQANTHRHTTDRHTHIHTQAPHPNTHTTHIIQTRRYGNTDTEVWSDTHTHHCMYILPLSIYYIYYIYYSCRVCV